MLVLQLLMKENLDLKLTPYKVLATSGIHGQFVLYTWYMKLPLQHLPGNFNCYWILKIQSLFNIVPFLTGFVQFIESTPVAEVLDKDEDKSIQVWAYLLCCMRDFLLVTFISINAVIFLSLQNYFRRHAPCEGAPLGISPEVMDTYVKSCGKHKLLKVPEVWCLNASWSHTILSLWPM